MRYQQAFLLGQPDASDVRIDPFLTNLSIGYRNPTYIADTMFPIVGVNERAGIVPQFDQSHWFRALASVRAPLTKSKGSGWTVDNTLKYFAERFSRRYEYDDDTKAMTQQPYDLDRTGTEFVTDQMQLIREVIFGTTLFTTGQWGSDKTGGVDFVQWNDYANSDPLLDISTYNDEIEGRIGREGNTIAMGKQVWVKLKWHPSLIDTIKHVERGQITVAIAQSLFELDKFLIGRALFTTSPEGTPEASVVYQRIWAKHVLLMFVAPSPSLVTPSAGYTFRWTQGQTGAAPQTIKRMRDEEREANIIEGNSYFDMKKTAPRAATFLSAAVI